MIISWQNNIAGFVGNVDYFSPVNSIMGSRIASPSVAVAGAAVHTGIPVTEAMTLGL